MRAYVRLGAALALPGAAAAWYLYYGPHIRTHHTREGVTSHIKSNDLAIGNLVTVKDYRILKDICGTLPKIEDLEVRQDDVFVVSFPKSGTTWVQEIADVILNGLDNAKSKDLDDRSPFLEFPCPGLGAIAAMPSPRLIKTHLPYSLLPRQVTAKRPRILYVVRSPRDVCVSYYHFCTKLAFIKFDGPFDAFFSAFVSGEVPYGPWWRHVSDYVKSDANILVVTYEHLHSKNHETIDKIAKFLGKDLSRQEISKISEHCEFSSMSKNPRTNYDWLQVHGLLADRPGSRPMFRRGQVGDWRTHMTDDMCRQMEAMEAKLTTE